MQTFFKQFREKTKRCGSIIATCKSCILNSTFVYGNYLSYFKSTGISAILNAVVI